MSGASGPFTELLWSGPSVSYAAQAASSAAAQFLMPGASGAFEQPYIPGLWWQIGRRNQRARVCLGGVLTGQASATTAIITVGLATASNTGTGTSLVASQALTVTSFAAVGWFCNVDIIARNVGYGTSSVSTSLLSDMDIQIGSAGGTGPPTLVSTFDQGAQAWVYATVTFSTSSTTNSCQLTRADVWGLN
jgi:hypothetical protein